MARTAHHLLLLILCCTWISSCGFQLRQDRVARHITEPMRILPAKSDTAKRLAASLQAQGIDIVDSAAWEIRLDNEKREKRAIALTSRATPAEYRLSHRLWVSLHYQDKVVIAPTLIEARRTLVVRPAEAAGMEQEERLLIRELEADVQQRILRWLAFSVTESLMANQP